MAKRTRVTDQEREAITAALKTGKSCREIASEFNRSADTISRIARDNGHLFGRTNVSNARAANLAYGAERRAQVRLRTVEVIEQTIGRFNEPTLVFSFGGKNNDYNEHLLDRPDARTMRDLGQTIATLWRVVREIDAAEAQAHDTAGLDMIFQQLEQVADENDSRPTVQPEASAGDQPE